MSIKQEINVIENINYALQFNKIKSLRHENSLIEIKIKEFKPKGFFNIVKRIFFGLNSFVEIQDMQAKIKKNNQTILDIEKDIQQQETLRLYTDIDLFIKKILKLESEFIQKKEESTLISEAKELDKRLSKYKNDLNKNSEKNWLKITEIISSFSQWRDRSNRNFIENEKKVFKSYFDTVESNPLTDMQKQAVVTNEENNLVLAGAGSGKTSVIIAKVGYILQKGLANTNEILILAFNKKAQEELSERIGQKLNVSVDAKTFHSYGLNIIAEATNEKPSLCKWSEDQSKLSELIHNIINTKLVDDKKFYSEFTKYFISYFVPYKSHEEFNNLGEYYDYIRNFDIRTFQGEKVKSFEECEIANQLFMWGVKYEYEPQYKHRTSNRNYRQYTPDFYLPEYDIYIEHFGISRDGSTAPYIDAKKYNEEREWKISLHNEHNTKLVETFSYEKKDGVLNTRLKDKLLTYDVQIRNISEEEALKAFNKHGMTDKFSKLFITFMGHYKSNQYNMNDLYEQANTDKRSISFLKVFKAVYDEYLNEKKKCACIDFDDMIATAVGYAELKKYRSQYKYILVDEFQDISAGRSKLVNAVRKQVFNSNVTVVGDDWQSINRFAGSDIAIIQNFENIFGNSETINLDYTFRFNSTVSTVATKFITKNPKQIEKIIKTNKNSNKPSFYVYWYQASKETSKYVHQIIALIAKYERSSEKKTIKILGRYGFNRPENLSKLKQEYKERFEVSYNTVHGSKGLEADYIILLGLESGKFGFPSQIEDDPLLNLVMPQSDDYLNAEERRLFYVALTRTKGKVFMLANMYQKSIFMEEILKDHEDDIYQLNPGSDDAESCPECKKGFLIKRKGAQHWFYGCSNYPFCEHTQKIKFCPTCKTSEVKKDLLKGVAVCKDESCDGYIKLCKKCDNYLVLRNGQYGNFLGCEGYPECKNTEKIT